MTAKRWVLYAGTFLIFILLLSVCFSGGEAEAAEMEPDTSSFVVQGEPMRIMLRATDARACWGWDFGPWQSKDMWGNLRYRYGVDAIACTNLSETRWVALPDFHPWHVVGFWSHDWTRKSNSDLGYSFLRLRTQWRFVFKPTGLPLLWKEPLLKCELRASNHTAYCERIY